MSALFHSKNYLFTQRTQHSREARAISAIFFSLENRGFAINSPFNRGGLFVEMRQEEKCIISIQWHGNQHFVDEFCDAFMPILRTKCTFFKILFFWIFFSFLVVEVALAAFFNGHHYFY